MTVAYGETEQPSVGGLVFTDDGILAGGEAGSVSVGYGGERRWCGEMGAYTDRPTLVDGYVSALDSYHRLRAFDRNSDDRPDGTTLPSGGVPRASIAGVGRTLLVGLNPLIAYGIQWRIRATAVDSPGAARPGRR